MILIFIKTFLLVLIAYLTSIFKNNKKVKNVHNFNITTFSVFLIYTVFCVCTDVNLGRNSFVGETIGILDGKVLEAFLAESDPI